MADLFNCCRICLQIKLTNASLYRYVDLKYLPSVIKNICGVVISSTEEPSALICKECAEAITKADAIIQKCQKSHKIFMRQRKLHDNNFKLKPGGTNNWSSAAERKKEIEFNAQDETQSFFQIYCAESEESVESVPENSLHKETSQEQKISRNDAVLLNESKGNTARKLSETECKKEIEFTAQDKAQSFFQIYCAESEMLVESIPENSLHEENSQEQNICGNDAVIRNESYNRKKARKLSAKHCKKEIELSAQNETLSFVQIYCAEPEMLVEPIPENSLHEETSQVQKICGDDVVLLNQSKENKARILSATESKKEIEFNAQDETQSFFQISCAEPERLLEPIQLNSLHKETSQEQEIGSNDVVLLNESKRNTVRILSAIESKKELDLNAEDETLSFVQMYCAKPENSLHEETSQMQEICSNDVILNEIKERKARKLSTTECKKEIEFNAQDETQSIFQIYCTEPEMLVEAIPENSLLKETSQELEIGSNDVVLLNERKRKTVRNLPAIEYKKELDLKEQDEALSFVQIYCAKPENSLNEETIQVQKICSNDVVLLSESTEKKARKFPAIEYKKEIESNVQDENQSFFQIYCAEPEMFVEPIQENSLYKETSQEQEIGSNNVVLLNEIKRKTRKFSAIECKKELDMNAQDETLSFVKIYCATAENSLHEEASQVQKLCSNDVVLLNESTEKKALNLPATEYKKEIELNAQDEIQSFFEIYCSDPEMLVESIPENSLHEANSQEQEIGSNDIVFLNESKRKTALNFPATKYKKEIEFTARNETQSFFQIYCAEPEMLVESIPEKSLHEENSQEQDIGSNDVVLLNESKRKTAQKFTTIECKKELDMNADETLSFVQIYCAKPEMVVETSHEQKIGSNDAVLQNDSKRKEALRPRPPLKFKDKKQHRGSSNSEENPSASLYFRRNKTAKPKTKFMHSREQYLKRKIRNYAVKEQPKVIGDAGVLLKRKPNSRVRVIPNFYFRCELCNEFESNVASFAVSHLKSFHGIDRPAIFRCSQCGIKPFIKNQSLQEHIATIHEQKPKQRKHICQECGNSYINNCDLRKHLLRTHKMVEGMSYKCKISKCNEACGDAGTLSLHMKQSHHVAEEKIESLSGLYRCDSCGESFMELHTLNSHITTVHTLEGFNCAHCDSTFKQKAQYETHIKRANCKPPCYECRYCDELFVQLVDLEEHQREKH